MKSLILSALALAAGLCGGCSKTESAATPALETMVKHEHHPPHGGAPVELGQEEYHVEFVLNASAGRLQAYVLDGELENFVRVSQATLEVIARVSGRDEALTLRAVANNATGEKLGDTSLFETQADWLKTTPQFDASLKEIIVRGESYTNVTFNFPKGSDEGAKP